MNLLAGSEPTRLGCWGLALRLETNTGYLKASQRITVIVFTILIRLSWDPSNARLISLLLLLFLV